MFQILWIRHAHSCGNAKEFSDRNKLYKAMHLQTRNPQLSDLGLMQIQQARQAVSDQGVLGDFLDDGVDLVCSSNMLRAIETAFLLFPHHPKIHVIPFVGEKSFSELARRLKLDLENQPESQNVTRSRLAAMGYDVSKIMYMHMIGKPDLMEFFSEIVLQHWSNPFSPNYLLRDRLRRQKDQRPFRVAIVSHGNFLREMVSNHTASSDKIWWETPYYQPAKCHRPHYRPQESAIGNCGMLLMPLTTVDVTRFLKRKAKLPRVFVVYETNAVYDETTGECMEYDGKRFILSHHGRKRHVVRCHPHIRAIETLKA